MRCVAVGDNLRHGKFSNQVVKLKSITASAWFKPALGAAVTLFCGLLLWGTRLGTPWENASYDYLFRFSARPITNRVVVVRMDKESDQELGQSGTAWNRAIHVAFLNKLAAEGARLVVFDVFFESLKIPETDAALAEAIRRCGHVVLATQVTKSKQEGAESATVRPPPPLFLEAAAGHGVGGADPSVGEIARRHYPFDTRGDGPFRSLAWAAVEAIGKPPDPEIETRWLRYYGEDGGWPQGCEPISYYRATGTNVPAGFFRDKIVFIGGWPEDEHPFPKAEDKFCTPYTRWNNQAIGGVEIHAITFLNLWNEDWLRRPAAWLEVLLVVATGILLGGGLCQIRLWRACLIGGGVALMVMLAFASWSYYTNYWFPWLVIAGGQVPCALGWAWLSKTQRIAGVLERFPGYTPVGESFGAGAFGTIWLVRNEAGHLQALKEVKRDTFEDADPYDREFHGLQTYMPISDRHLELLQVKHVRRFDKQGYFFYVMELGDPLDPDWQQNGQTYKALDLAACCVRAGGRLTLADTLRVGIAIAEALEILHQGNLVHRDIKPSNIVFVRSRPKLADVGLVRKAPKPGEKPTLVFTPNFEDPLGLGTMLADLYALAITLYVASTGKPARSFSELSTTLVVNPGFMRLNEIICKACQLDAHQRYASATEMLHALRAAQTEWGDDPTRRM